MILKHIKVGGKAKPFLFSYLAITEMQKADLKEKNEMEYLAYLGFKYGAIKVAKDAGKPAEIDFKEEDIADWFEDDLDSYFEVVEVIAEMKPKLEKMMASLAGQQKRSQKKNRV